MTQGLREATGAYQDGPQIDRVYLSRATGNRQRIGFIDHVQHATGNRQRGAHQHGARIGVLHHELRDVSRGEHELGPHRRVTILPHEQPSRFLAARTAWLGLPHREARARPTGVLRCYHATRQPHAACRYATRDAAAGADRGGWPRFLPVAAPHLVLAPLGPRRPMHGRAGAAERARARAERFLRVARADAAATERNVQRNERAGPRCQGGPSAAAAGGRTDAAASGCAVPSKQPAEAEAGVGRGRALHGMAWHGGAWAGRGAKESYCELGSRWYVIGKDGTRSERSNARADAGGGCARALCTLSVEWSARRCVSTICLSCESNAGLVSSKAGLRSTKGGAGDKQGWF